MHLFNLMRPLSALPEWFGRRRRLAILGFHSTVLHTLHPFTCFTRRGNWRRGYDEGAHLKLRRSSTKGSRTSFLFLVKEIREKS
eukprot:5681681-Amphidinium_carterae.1